MKVIKHDEKVYMFRLGYTRIPDAIQTSMSIGQYLFIEDGFSEAN